MFYNKDIEILNKSNELKIDEYGIPVKEYTLLKAVKADVQPISISKVRRTYGDYQNASYEIFINSYIPQFTTQSKVKYNGVEYDVLSISAWNDSCMPYMQALIGKEN